MPMPNQDVLALNNDGTLKDAKEIEWVHSPSDETVPKPQKHKRSNSSASDSNDVLLGLKNKVPAKKIGNKHVLKISKKAVAGAEFYSPKSH